MNKNKKNLKSFCKVMGINLEDVISSRFQKGEVIINMRDIGMVRFLVRNGLNLPQIYR